MSERSPESRSDEVLMAAYASGDPRAFEILFDRYAPWIYRIIRRGVSDDETAKDLVQQTFVQVHRARRDYDPSRPFRPWLATIARNVKRDWIRRHVRRPEGHLAEDALEDRATQRADQEAAIDARRLRAAVGTLPDNQREVIELHWFEGLPMGEIAEILGASRTAVKVRAHRAYQALRALITTGGVTTRPDRTNPRDEE